ncbi:MAG: hypothetical protein ACFB14_06100 [Leptolyngbyaceae cyanobacterium]
MKLVFQKEISPMPKIVIGKLFYELETTEQKTHRGGIGKLPFLTLSKSGPTRTPIYESRMWDPDVLATFLATATKADIYGL